VETCNSCGERHAVVTITASNDQGTVLDIMHICYDCTEEKVIELLPGCKDAKPA
jgi:protein-arginine kinase activator protein McsA